MPPKGRAADALPEAARAWIAPLAADLLANRGRSVVAAGPEQPAAVHALAHAINAALGNLGESVVVVEPIEARPVNQLDSLRELAADMEAGRVEMLIILGGNPVYRRRRISISPRKLDKVPFRVHLGLEQNETSELCHWHIPEAHSLEAWGDARAYDGTVSIIQPLILPLYDGKSALEVMAAVLGEPESQGYDVVRQHWQRPAGRREFRKSLAARAARRRGARHARRSAKAVQLRAGFDQPSAQRGGEGLRSCSAPTATVWDGRFANNGWLQELPRPMTLLTWDNVALLSPATAEKLGVANEDVVELQLGERQVEAPVWISPGHADNAVTVTLGYGRKHVGRVGQGVGFQRRRDPHERRVLAGRRARDRARPRDSIRWPRVQDHYRMEGRDLIRRADLTSFARIPRRCSTATKSRRRRYLALSQP